MSIASYIKSCSNNISGNKYLYLAEMRNIESVTITGNQITEITMISGGYFYQIEAEQDSIQREVIGDDGLAVSYEHKVEFKLAKPGAGTKIFTDSLRHASPGGIVALVIDGNDKPWLAGWNYIESYRRGLILSDYEFSCTRVDEPHEITYQLKRKNECPDLEFNNDLDEYLLSLARGGVQEINFGEDLEGMDGSGLMGMDGSDLIGM